MFCVLSIHACLFSRETLSEQENRALADFPKIHTWRKDLPKFPTAFEPYFKDHLPFRLALICTRNLAAFEIFNTSGNPLVVIGKQNWLFYKSYGVTPAQLNLEPFTEDELHDWAQNIVERNSFLKQHHIKFLLVLAPEKGSMYPELLPPGWHRSNRITRLEQLQNYLKEHTNVDFVDARHLLAEEKAAGQKIYHSEAKSDFNFDKLAKYCCALANEGGGQLVLGVTDCNRNTPELQSAQFWDNNNRN